MSRGETALTLRERKRQATRERLLSTALELFGTRGYDGTTMDDIAAGADVSRATAFNYFPKKEEFLQAWVQDRRDLVRALMDREQDQDLDAITRLEHVLVLLGDRVEADPELNRAITQAWVKAGLVFQPGAAATADLFAEVIRQGQARGEIRSDVDAARIGRVLLDAYFGALMRWAGVDAGVSLKSQLATVITLMNHALRPD